MINIAVCDDEEVFLEQISSYIADYLSGKGIDWNIETFLSGEELLSKENAFDFDIYFLDVSMEDMDGMETAINIRKHTDKAYIVFVTAYISYALDGYKVDAVRYILKDSRMLRLSINECLDAVFQKMDYRRSRKVFDFNEGEIELRIEDLLYIESRLHKCEVHVLGDKEKIYTLYSTLNRIEDELRDFDFLRIHQSFLVNMGHIDKIHKNRAYLSTGMDLIIPKARYREVKNAYIAYKGRL